MKRKIKIALVLFLLLMIPFGVKAEKITCSRIMDEHENYLQYKDQFDSINCNDIDSSEKADKCNDLSTNINSSLQFLYNSVDSYPNCSTSEIQTTLNDNDTNCKSVFQTDMKETTKNIMTFFYVVAPFLLILFGSIDLTKIVSANDPEGMKKAKSNLTKRITAFLLIYILPLFVNLLLSFVSNEYKLDGNYYSCKTQYYSYQKKYAANFTRLRRSVTASTDWHIDWFQGDDRWASHAWYGDSGSVGGGGCGSLATSIVCAHYLGDDSENSPCYPLNTADEYYRHALQPNLSREAINTFFNEWHPEVGVTATKNIDGPIDLNELDEVLSKGGCAIVDYYEDITYNGAYVWTSQGHYVTIFAGNQVDGYRVADSNSDHNDGWSGIAEWAPYGEHIFDKEFIENAGYYYYIEKK